MNKSGQRKRKRGKNAIWFWLGAGLWLLHVVWEEANKDLKGKLHGWMVGKNKTAKQWIALFKRGKLHGLIVASLHVLTYTSMYLYILYTKYKSKSRL